MTRPTRSLLIGANQRSGSTMLCRLLTATGIAGRPTEHLLAVDPVRYPDWPVWEDGPLAREHGVTDRRRFLDLVHEVGTTPNGVFGLKMQWNTVALALGRFRELPELTGASAVEILHRYLPDVRCVLLTRADTARQAVSWARAAQDDVWLVSDHEPARPVGEPVYDGELIGNLERLVLDGERRWRELLGRLGAPTIEVVYEELVDEPERHLRRILELLEVDHPGPLPTAPGVRRQADALNDEWVARYRAGSAAR